MRTIIIYAAKNNRLERRPETFYYGILKINILGKRNLDFKPLLRKLLREIAL